MTKDVFSKLKLHGKRYSETARVNMIKGQIRTWDVTDSAILDLFEKVDRQDFVPNGYHDLAFADIYIPLGHGQTMMTPKEEARVLQELKIQNTDRILLLGVESGYLLALLSRLGGQVYHINNDLDSFEHIQQIVEKYRLPNVNPLVGNLTSGWRDYAPFNVIILTGSLAVIPQEFKNALDLGARLFLVVGNAPVMEAMMVTRVSENTWSERKLFETYRPRMIDAKEPNTFTF